ncbi:MAG: DUF309 domain-containing protein [Prochlorothrix sp.]
MEVPNSSSLPPQFWDGVAQFNAQEFYACHDTLEELWTEAVEPDRTFYQGILQLAVALYHLSNGNWRGSVTLLGESLGRLATYSPDYEGVNVESLRAQSRTLLQQLQDAGPDRVGDYGGDRSAFAIPLMP